MELVTSWHKQLSRNWISSRPGKPRRKRKRFQEKIFYWINYEPYYFGPLLDIWDFYSDFCYGSQRLKLHRILKKPRFIKDLRKDSQNIWSCIMTEATIQFDFHLSSSYFLFPKTLTLPMKLSKYITMISSAFCTTK